MCWEGFQSSLEGLCDPKHPGNSSATTLGQGPADVYAEALTSPRPLPPSDLVASSLKMLHPGRAPRLSGSGLRCAAGSERVSSGGHRGGLGGGSGVREWDLVYVLGAVSADLGMGSPSEGLTVGAKQVADAFLLEVLGGEGERE